MLRLLARVPIGEEPDTIDLAFQSVQLLCSDYVSVLTHDQQRKCLEVAAAYGSQQADVNVSLTAISLLWNAADSLGRPPQRSAAAATERPSEPAGGFGSDGQGSGEPGEAFQRPYC